MDNYYNHNNRELYKLDKHLSNYYVSKDEDFFDLCLDKIGKGLKFIGKKTLEYLKKKYMIGKYSSNYKKRLSAYSRGLIVYNQCVNLYDIIISDNIVNRKLTNNYIFLCNKLNKICSVFKEELPELDFYNAQKAISNFEEVENYINMLKNRSKKI